MRDLTPREIIHYLQVLPQHIGDQARKAEDAEYALRVCKHELDIATAKAYLETKAKFDKPTAKELEHRVTLDVEVIAKQAELIAKEGAWRSEKIALETLSNKFIGLRKIASLRELELRAIPE